MTIISLEQELKEGKLSSIYLLYGEETYILETCLKKIQKLFGETVLGINYIQIDETNIDTLIDNINMPAFGYEKKLIVVKNAGLFKKNVGAGFHARPKTDIAANLAEYIEKNIDIIKDAVVLVIVEDDINKNELSEAIQKYGAVCNFEKLKPAEIIKRLKGITNAYEVKANDDTLKYLIETSGESMQVLINEIRKLIEYAGKGGTITKSDVDSLATKTIESVIFDLTDNLGKREIKKALDTLNGLLYNKEPIQKILVTLYNHFKKLYIIKLVEDYNYDIPSALNLKPNQMFLVTKYKKQAEYFDIKELRQILEALINLDSNYKVGLIDINIGLEAILCRYCG